jgi:hypothetical protein
MFWGVVSNVFAGAGFIEVVSVVAAVVSVLVVFSPPPPQEVRKNTADAINDHASKSLAISFFLIFIVKNRVCAESELHTEQ